MEPRSIDLLPREIRALVAAPIEVILALRIPTLVGERLWVREPWRAWEDKGHDESGPWQQVYVAYQATVREGFRASPDRARITYLDETSAIDATTDRRLLGPWSQAMDMPRDFSRITLEVFAPQLARAVEVAGWTVPR
jgi:hypothetical protein